MKISQAVRCACSWFTFYLLTRNGTEWKNGILKVQWSKFQKKVNPRVFTCTFLDSDIKNMGIFGQRGWGVRTGIIERYFKAFMTNKSLLIGPEELYFAFCWNAFSLELDCNLFIFISTTKFICFSLLVKWKIPILFKIH